MNYYINLEKSIYKIYLICMVFDKIKFLILPAVLQTYIFFNISSFWFYCGMFILLISKRGKIRFNKSMLGMFFLVMYFVIASFLLSTLNYNSFGILYGETTYRAIMGDCFFYIMEFLFVLYNSYGLTYLLSAEDVKKVFLIQNNILLTIGYLQLFVIRNIPFSRRVYDFIGKIFSVVPVEQLETRGISFFQSEIALASNTIIFNLSFIAAMYFSEKDSKAKRNLILRVACLLPLLLMAKSSTVIISLCMFIVTILFFSRSYFVKKIWFLEILIGSIYILYFTFWNDIVLHIFFKSNSFMYYLIQKVLSTSNLSTQVRLSTIVNDVKILFSKNFLFGVGNGNQGFFYNQNLPDWVNRNYIEIANRISGNMKIINGGGALFPAIISGFGVIGIVIFIFFVKQYYKTIKNNRLLANVLKLYFVISMIQLMLSLWVFRGVIQDHNIAFLLAIPYIYEKNKIGGENV